MVIPQQTGNEAELSEPLYVADRPMLRWIFAHAVIDGEVYGTALFFSYLQWQMIGDSTIYREAQRVADGRLFGPHRESYRIVSASQVAEIPVDIPLIGQPPWFAE